VVVAEAALCDAGVLASTVLAELECVPDPDAACDDDEPCVDPPFGDGVRVPPGCAVAETDAIVGDGVKVAGIEGELEQAAAVTASSATPAAPAAERPAVRRIFMNPPRKPPRTIRK